MTPQERAAELLRQIREEGWEMEFTAQGNGQVHIVSPDCDQPGYDSVVDALMNRKVRAICGRLIRRTAIQGATVSTPFDDERLHPACHAAFPTPEDQELIFAANVEPYVSSGLWAPRTNESIRSGRRMDQDRRERAEVAGRG
ncbi:MAG: hypothetical protein ACJ786_20175 [Catenulispora sp.]